jgi:hypothetical protein
LQVEEQFGFGHAAIIALNGIARQLVLESDACPPPFELCPPSAAG